MSIPYYDCNKCGDVQTFTESERKIKTLTEGLESIKRHMELSKAGALSNVWHIAHAALTKAEVIGK